MLHPTDDLRIDRIRPLIPPAILMEELPLTERGVDHGGREPRGGRAHPARRGRPARGRGRPLLDPRRRRPALEYAARPARGRRPSSATTLLHRDARLLREAAHDGRLEGADQRPAPRRQLRDQRGAARRAPPAARRGRAGPARRAPSSSTRSRRSSSPTWSAGARSARAPPRARCTASWRSGLSMPVGFKNGTDGNVQIAIDAIRRPRTRTTSCRSPSRAWRRSSPRAATPTATSSCAAATAARTTTPPTSRAAVAALETARLRAAPDDRLQPRQQRQGPRAPAGGGARRRGADRAGGQRASSAS